MKALIQNLIQNQNQNGPIYQILNDAGTDDEATENK